MSEVIMDSDSLGAHQLQFRGVDEFIWRGVVHLKSGDIGLSYCVGINSNLEERSSSAEWTVRVLDAAITAAEKGHLSAFRDNNLTCFLSEVQTIKNEPQKVIVSEAFQKQIEQEHEHDERARTCFKQLVQKIERGVGNLPHGESSDLLVQLSFIERMLRCAYLGNEYEWYGEKISGIRMYIRDLARRKNRNHPSFLEGVDYIRSNLFMFSAPTVWLERPGIVGITELECA